MLGINLIFGRIKSTSRILYLFQKLFLLTYVFFASFFVWNVYNFFNTAAISETYTAIATRPVASASSLFVEKYPHITRLCSDIVTDEELEKKLITLIVNYLTLSNDLKQADFLTESDIQLVLKVLFNIQRVDSHGSIQYRKLS